MSAQPAPDFAPRLLAWFERHGRHDLPWQHPRTPYRVWLSEIMLQQTRVETVVPYFERFVERFPTLSALAAADLDEVLALWSGLGYYARARNLHRAAIAVRERHGGELPGEFDALAALPGIGRSTAGAILALAHGQRHPILDGNAKRVLARHRAVAGWPGESTVAVRLWDLAEHCTPAERVADYTQAIMDLGAGVCTRARPACDACPVAADCEARMSGDPTRYPVPRPRRELPQRSTRMLILRRRDGTVLLERRPPAGVWGGLWCLPECPAAEDVVEWCRRALDLRVSEPRSLPRFRHTFTHFQLDVAPLLLSAEPGAEVISDGGARVWLHPEKPVRLGLPAPVRRLLESAAEWPRGDLDGTHGQLREAG